MSQVCSTMSDVTHTLSLVREYFTKNLTISDVASLLLTDRVMRGLMTGVLKQVPNNQKMTHHLLRILKKPFKQRRSSLIRVTLLGDIDLEEDGSRDRIYNTVYAITMRPSSRDPTRKVIHFDISLFLSRYANAFTEVFFTPISKKTWRKVFRADIQQVAIEHVGWNNSDIEDLKREIQHMLYSYGYIDVALNSAQVREIHYDYIDEAALPY